MSLIVLTYLTTIVLTVSADIRMSMYSNVKFEVSQNNPDYIFGIKRSSVGPPYLAGTDAPEVIAKGYDPSLQESVKVAVAVTAVFRQNLIKLFGYVLHRPDMELSTDLYTSLYFILYAIKMNDVDLLQLAPRLYKLSFMKSNERFEEIFRLLEEYLPPYLTCAATVWKEAIKEEIVNMHNILVPFKDGFLIVDLFHGTTPFELQTISKNDFPLTKPENIEEQKIVYNFNPNVLYIFRIMKNYTRSLQPWLIGSMFHFFPKRETHPEIEESILIVDQYLKQVRIKQWKNYRKQLKHIKWENPYQIIKFFLDKLASDESGDIHYVIRDAALSISYSFHQRNPTAINQNYHSMAALLKPEVDPRCLLVLLSYISIGQYPKEVVFAAHRYQYYLDQCYIRYLNAVFCFNPYIYNSVPEILMALSLRILRKQSDLALEILDSVGTVYSWLLFNYRFTLFPAIIPDDIFNINSIILGVRSPDILHTVRSMILSQTRLLMMEPANYYEILKIIPPSECSQPSLCFIALLHKMYELKMFKSALLNLTVSEVLASSCRIGYCPVETRNIETNIIPTHIFKDIQKGDFEIRKYDKNHILSSIIPTDATEGPVRQLTTLPSTLPTTPTPVSVNIFSSKKTLPAIFTHTFYPSDSTLPPSFFDDAEIILDSNRTTKINSKKLLKILKSKKFQKFFKEHKGHHAILLTLFAEVLQKLVKECKTLDDQKIDKHFEEFLVQQIKLLNTYKLQLHYSNFEVKPAEPSLLDLMVALPAPSNNNIEEKKKHKHMKAILQNQQFFKFIEKKITKDKYASVGILLKAVLEEFGKLHTKFTKDSLEVIKYYIPRVQMNGFGEGKITYVIPEKRIIKTVDLIHTLENGVALNTLNVDQRLSLYEIIKYLKEDIDIAGSFSKGYLYTTCGEFTKAFFTYLLEQPNTPVDVAKSVENLIPLIVFDKTGELPSYRETEH